MRIRRLQKFITILLTIIFIHTALFTSTADAKTAAKTAYVDIDSGVLNIRSGPGKQYKIIGTVKKNTKLTVYSEKNNWAETRYNKKKGYASNEFLRYNLKKISNAEAKRITDNAVKTLRKARFDRDYTKAQLKAIWKPNFTESYMNKLIKYDYVSYGRNKNGTTLYSIREGDFPAYFILFEPDWKKEYTSKAPTVKHYKKNGKQYLKVYSRYKTDLYPHYVKLSFTRSSSKGAWKVYNYSWYDS